MSSFTEEIHERSEHDVRFIFYNYFHISSETTFGNPSALHPDRLKKVIPVTSMLVGSLVTMAGSVLVLRMEETASSYGG
jgi:hypothetical protein